MNKYNIGKFMLAVKVKYELLLHKRTYKELLSITIIFERGEKLNFISHTCDDIPWLLKQVNWDMTLNTKSCFCIERIYC